MFVVVYNRDRVTNAEIGPAQSEVDPKQPEAPKPSTSTDSRVVVETADAGTGDDEEGYGYGV